MPQPRTGRCAGERAERQAALPLTGLRKLRTTRGLCRSRRAITHVALQILQVRPKSLPRRSAQREGGRTLRNGEHTVERHFIPVLLLVGYDDAVVHAPRSEEHTSELQSLAYLVCRLLL